MKCSTCATRNGLHAIGNCSGCGFMISQRSDKFCEQCSTTKNVCQTCGCQLPPPSGVSTDTAATVATDSND